MRTEREILERIKEIEEERQLLLKDYQATNDETERGIIAERNMGSLEIIQQLKWVLKAEHPDL